MPVCAQQHDGGGEELAACQRWKRVQKVLMAGMMSVEEVCFGIFQGLVLRDEMSAVLM